MGQITDAFCKCGFHKKGLLLGSGMNMFDDLFDDFSGGGPQCNFPYLCVGCNHFFLGNFYKNDISCPKCKKDNVLLITNHDVYQPNGKVVFNEYFSGDTEDIRKEKILTEGNYMCPKCGEFNLKFNDSGDWD